MVVVVGTGTSTNKGRLTLVQSTADPLRLTLVQSTADPLRDMSDMLVVVLVVVSALILLPVLLLLLLLVCSFRPRLCLCLCLLSSYSDSDSDEDSYSDEDSDEDSDEALELDTLNVVARVMAASMLLCATLRSHRQLRCCSHIYKFRCLVECRYQYGGYMLC